MRAESSDFSFTTQDLATTPPPYVVAMLVEEVLRGNNEAKAKFYEAFSPVVKGFIRKWNIQHFEPLGFRALDEEDTLQTVMIRLIYGDRFTGGGFNECDSPLRGWLNYDGARSMSLYGYVRRNVNHYLRDLRRNSNSGRSRHFSPNAPEDPAMRDEMLEADAGFTAEERAQLRRCSRKCWREMNPSYREVLEYVGVMGFSQSETAEKLGISEATVSRWLRDAKNEFRNCLEYNCPEELLPFSIIGIR
jgi:RNA polymerase sigma factor (sigma-70 family)